MGLTRCRLGDYIKRSTVNNRDLKYGSDLIAGVTSDGVFSEPKGDVSDVDLSPYKIVDNGAFVYNPSRLDLGSIAFRTDGTCIVSHLYVVFYLTEEGKKQIDPIYLFVYFRRNEFHREVTFRNWGSQRSEFGFDDMSEIEIDLPPIEVQRRYAAIYEGLDGNRRDNLRRLSDLKLACDAAIEQLEVGYSPIKIGPYIEQSDERNVVGLGKDSVRGLSIDKRFIGTKASLVGVNLSNYKVVRRGDMAYVPVTSRNGGKITVAHNDGSESYLISPINTVFRVKPSCADRLLPEYLMLFFTRGEFDRYARYHSWGSARETFDWDEMCAVRIPIPDIEAQQALVDLYRARSMRVGINQSLVCLLLNICPVLIKGSIDEARREG